MDAQNERHQKACTNLGTRKELSLIVFRGYNILTHVVDGTTEQKCMDDFINKLKKDTENGEVIDVCK